MLGKSARPSKLLSRRHLVGGFVFACVWITLELHEILPQYEVQSRHGRGSGWRDHPSFLIGMGRTTEPYGDLHDGSSPEVASARVARMSRVPVEALMEPTGTLTRNHISRAPL
jgi:hypothetical protein